MNNTTKTIIIAAGVLVVGLGLMFWGRTQVGSGAGGAGFGASSTLVASETVYDFGTISMSRGKVSHLIQITNPTAQDITLSELVTSCMCTNAYWVKGDGSKMGPFGMQGMGYVPPLNQVLKAGETGQVEVVYDPAAHGPAGVGAIDRFIYLTAAQGGSLQLEIKALVTP